MSTKSVNLEYFHKFEQWARQDERMRITAGLTPLLMKMGDDGIAAEILMYLRQTYPAAEPEPVRKRSGPIAEDAKAAACAAVRGYLQEGHHISLALRRAAEDTGIYRGTLMKYWYSRGGENGKPGLYN